MVNYLIIDEEGKVSNIMQYIYKMLGTKIKAISPYHHRSLRSESFIKAISIMLTECKHLLHYLQMTMFACMFGFPSLDG